MTPKRNYRDSLFRSYFNNKRLLLELANLLEGTHYTNPKAIRITTLKGTFFNDLKNDISFQLENRFLVLFEHQSTVNENMPLRCLFYLSKLLQKRIEQRDLYKEELLKIPAPCATTACSSTWSNRTPAMASLWIRPSTRQ